jgi:hypothetical protein
VKVKWFNVCGAGLLATMPAVSAQSAREGFCRATGVHFENTTVEELIDSSNHDISHWQGEARWEGSI